MTPVSPQGGFLPPPSALAEHEPAIQEADTQGQAQAQNCLLYTSDAADECVNV